MAGLVLRRDQQPWIIGLLGVIAAGATGLLAALFTRRSNQETEFIKGLAEELRQVRGRVTDLESKVERLERELDTERQQVLALTAERDGLQRENLELTARNTQLSARNLELENVVASLKRTGAN